MTRTRRRLFNDHYWTYRNRKIKYSKMVGDEDNFHLTCGYYFDIDKNIYSTRKLSKVQKNVRQFLYNLLQELGITGRYIINIEGPTALSSNKIYLDLQIYCPTTRNDKEICEQVVDKLFQELEHFIFCSNS